MMDRVLLIGDIERAEFARLMQALTRIYRVSVARNPRMALRAMRGGETWSRIRRRHRFPASSCGATVMSCATSAGSGNFVGRRQLVRGRNSQRPAMARPATLLRRSVAGAMCRVPQPLEGCRAAGSE